MATFTVAPPAVGQLGGAGGAPFPSGARCPRERPLSPDQGGSHPGPAVNGHSRAVGEQRLHPGRPSCRHTRCPSSLGTGAPPGPDTGHLHCPATLRGHGGKPLPSRSLPPRLSPAGTLCPPSSVPSPGPTFVLSQDLIHGGSPSAVSALFSSPPGGPHVP